MEDSKGLSYFFLGLGIGVAVGIVFAPQSGSETRELIKNKAQEGGEYLKRRGEEIRENAADMVERGKTTIRSQREHLNAAVEAGKQAYRDAVTPKSADLA